MKKNLDVIIVGAGTAGLTARREVAKKTNDYLVIHDGPTGTTCARVGCMPSKVLIQAANDFNRRKVFSEVGIKGGEQLSLDGKKVMSHVRSLRDRFVRGVRGGMESWESTHLLKGRATFKDPHTLVVNGEEYKAKEIILGIGSRPLIIGAWNDYKDFILTSDQIFEMEDLPESLMVVGLGVIGIELGQAFSRLGVKTYGATIDRSIGGSKHPELQDYISDYFQSEFDISFDGATPLKRLENGKLLVEFKGEEVEVDKVLMAAGRRPNIDKIGLENLDLDPDKVPEFNTNTLRLSKHPHIFIPGDVNANRPILHEAADEGVIVGKNSLSNEAQCFQRRVPLGVTFTDPNIGFTGLTYDKLEDGAYVTGEVSFEGQGRAIVKLKEKGMLKVYVSKKDHKIIGAELFAPDGEHLLHLLSWAITAKLTVFEALKMPFYHPVVEEGLKTALRDAACKLSDCSEPELFRCEDTPIR